VRGSDPKPDFADEGEKIQSIRQYRDSSRKIGRLYLVSTGSIIQIRFTLKAATSASTGARFFDQRHAPNKSQ
jgi:hypothetical protein